MVDSDAAVVLDAYSLGVLKDLPEVYRRWAGRLLLTPNLEELHRLLDLRSDRSGRPSLAGLVREAAQQYQAVVTCQNVIGSPARRQSGRCAPNCIGLATSGSGDVLAGAALGLLARGADPAQAACWATYVHLAAGHRMTRRIGTLGFLARELLTEIPLALRALS